MPIGNGRPSRPVRRCGRPIRKRTDRVAPGGRRRSAPYRTGTEPAKPLAHRPTGRTRAEPDGHGQGGIATVTGSAARHGVTRPTHARHRLPDAPHQGGTAPISQIPPARSTPPSRRVRRLDEPTWIDPWIDPRIRKSKKCARRQSPEPLIPHTPQGGPDAPPEAVHGQEGVWLSMDAPARRPTGRNRPAAPSHGSNPDRRRDL